MAWRIWPIPAQVGDMDVRIEGLSMRRATMGCAASQLCCPCAVDSRSTTVHFRIFTRFRLASAECSIHRSRASNTPH
jgi:hypothetical protein